jgi:hypothetical protein
MRNRHKENDNMPDPREGESKDNFMSRCMGDDKMVDEFGNPQQRAAVCNSFFERKATAGMEDYIFSTPEGARKKSREIGFNGEIHSDKMADGTMMYFPAKDEKTFQEWFDKNDSHTASEDYEDWGETNVTAAEYQGRKVTLNKPFRTPGQRKKFAVYTTNSSGKVIIVRFGDPNMEIKRDDPKRRKAFRDRHNCDTAKDKTTPRYWSCRQWRGGSRVEASKHDPRSTPAPPEDRRRGSKKNEPGSARPGGKVTFSEQVTNSLKAKVKSHNEKSDRKVTLGMLKAVYRRGAGAYSTSHRPGVSRAAWSMARVNAFLTLVRRGRPANSKYVQDNDLLPSNHPKKSRKADIDITEEDENISMASEDCGCGCGGCGETVEAASHQYDNPADAMEQAKKMGCDEIHTHDVNGETMFMPCKDMREYQEKSGGKMEVEGYKHEDEEMEAGYHKKKMASESCPVGEEMVEGVCKPIAVTMEITIDDVLAKVEASTGKNIIEISGIAFHEGKNKNNWSLTRKGAELAVSQMVGADLTLNHPKPSNIGFSRNMDGGIDEAVVGVITEASIHDLEDGKWNVRYKAEVHRVELFEALDSGLWLRAGYGVSIGGYGVPIQANDDGIVFENDFTFDHLAIVHRPAYPRANIELAEKKQKAMASETFKYQGDSETDYQKGEIPMDDEMINEEMGAVASEALAEAEKLKADLILAQATIAEYKAIEAKKVEDERLGLVAKATEMGLKGHEDLSSETITQLIASWESAKPTVEEVEMKPATPAVASEQVKPVSQSVVANYLNGKIVETPEEVYEKAYNAWASAWNKTLSGVEATEGRFVAPKYNDIKEMI